MEFSDLGLSPQLLRAIEEAGYTRPTPIQEKAIPIVLQGRDVLGCAQTGTGKTAGFALPMLDILAAGRARARMPRALILEPTRELAAQVADAFAVYGKHHRIETALLIGGVSMEEQSRKLDRGADILIATPGRLLDHADRGQIVLRGVKMLVIDETDRMLDMGFIPDVQRIVRLLPPARQTLFFSATLDGEIRSIGAEFVTNPKEISVAPPSSVVATVRQALVHTPPQDKRRALHKLIEAEGIETAIVFLNRKRECGHGGAVAEPLPPRGGRHPWGPCSGGADGNSGAVPQGEREVPGGQRRGRPRVGYSRATVCHQLRRPRQPGGLRPPHRDAPPAPGVRAAPLPWLRRRMPRRSPGSQRSSATQSRNTGPGRPRRRLRPRNRCRNRTRPERPQRSRARKSTAAPKRRRSAQSPPAVDAAAANGAAAAPATPQHNGSAADGSDRTEAPKKRRKPSAAAPAAPQANGGTTDGSERADARKKPREPSAAAAPATPQASGSTADGSDRAEAPTKPREPSAAAAPATPQASGSTADGSDRAEAPTKPREPAAAAAPPTPQASGSTADGSDRAEAPTKPREPAAAAAPPTPQASGSTADGSDRAEAPTKPRKPPPAPAASGKVGSGQASCVGIEAAIRGDGGPHPGLLAPTGAAAKAVAA